MPTSVANENSQKVHLQPIPIQTLPWRGNIPTNTIHIYMLIYLLLSIWAQLPTSLWTSKASYPANAQPRRLQSMLFFTVTSGRQTPKYFHFIKWLAPTTAREGIYPPKFSPSNQQNI
jgi:hypothetical protein